MIVEKLFDDNDIINIRTYLNKYGVEDWRRYLEPSEECIENPFRYNNMKNAVAFLDEAILEVNNDNKIYILQDCDVDGVCSSALIYMFLLDEGVSRDNIRLLVHSDKSHGLTKEIMEQIGNDCKWFIVPDAGTNDYNQQKELNNRGIKILIADHHIKESDNEFGENTIVVNSQLQKLNNNHLCGTGVMWKVLCAYSNSDREQDMPLVAFANLSDVMNMTSLENRYLNSILMKNYESVDFLNAQKNAWIKDDLNPTSVVWNITPKINASIRSGDLDLLRQIFMFVLTGEDNGTIKACARAHRQQQNLVKSKVEEILPTINQSEKVLIGFTEPSAYTGLIAGKLCGMFNKPTLLVYENNGYYMGSVRAPSSFKRYCTGHLFTYAMGHEAAFGIKFPKENLDEIRNYFSTLKFSNESKYTVVKSLNANHLNEVEKMIKEFSGHDDLWAEGIPKPQFHIHIKNLSTNDIKTLGNGSTIKFSCGDMDFIKFFVGAAEKERYHIGENKQISVDVIGEIGINTFNNTDTIQMVVDKLEMKPYVNRKTLDDLF